MTQTLQSHKPSGEQTRAGGFVPAQIPIAAWIAVAIIVAAVFVYEWWLLDPRNYFYADDWQWLERAEYLPWDSGYFGLLPDQIFNDRPVGAAVIKALYELVGLNHLVFEIVLLSLHALNCVLLYVLAVRYTNRAGALLAALLAALWFSAHPAVGWTAAIFDVLGVTLCFSAMLLRQRAVTAGNPLRFDIAGAACYLLAIRTKEFAFGLVALLVVQSLIVERQSLRMIARQMLPYFVVFAVYAVRYALLFPTTAPAQGDVYHLNISLSGILYNLNFYLRALFYVQDDSAAIGLGILLTVLGAGLLAAEDRAQRLGVFAIAGFVILLGPVLLLSGQRVPQYVYASHFFMALIIGALLTRRAVPALVATAASIVIVAAPFRTHFRENVINFQLGVGEANQAMLASGIKALGALPSKATVFISGVPIFFNPFSTGNALRIAFKGTELDVEVEKPEAELAAKFCATAGEKRFLRFKGTQGTDVTAEMTSRCGQPSHG